MVSGREPASDRFFIKAVLTGLGFDLEECAIADKAFDLIIIGGGPAGLTAGIYAARARLSVLLIEKGLCGGQIAATEKIENYPGFTEPLGGGELTSHMEAQAKEFGLNIKTFAQVESVSERDGSFLVKTGDETFSALTLIVATGATPARLGVPGESEFTGRGVSYCATCDGAFFRDKDVIVVGGGNAAVEEALFLTRFAKKVSIIHRRDEFRADKILVERAAKDERIEFLLGYELASIEGDGKVERVRIKSNKDEGEKIIPAEGVFMYVGTHPNSSFLTNIIKLDEKGYIITQEDLGTSRRGIFAAGDVRRNGAKQVVIAAGEGALAAISAQRYLSELAEE